MLNNKKLKAKQNLKYFKNNINNNNNKNIHKNKVFSFIMIITSFLNDIKFEQQQQQQQQQQRIIISKMVLITQ
jgi:hypothetical protein